MCYKTLVPVLGYELSQAEEAFTYAPQESGVVVRYHEMAIIGMSHHPSSASLCSLYAEPHISLHHGGVRLLYSHSPNGECEGMAICMCVFLCCNSRRFSLGHRAGTQGDVETAATEHADIPGALNWMPLTHCTFES